MYSFTSNFKKFKHVYFLLLLAVAGVVCAMMYNVIIYHIRIKSDASISENKLFDDFFGRKCLPASYPVIFYGDSRVFNCISPDIVSRILQRPSFNMAFSSGGMNETMMKLIDSRIKKEEKKPVIVLGITPYSLTENARKNDCYRTYSARLRNSGKSMFLSTKGLRFIDIITMQFKNIHKVGSLRNGKIHRDKSYYKRYHDNGWVETVVTDNTSKSIEKTLEMYEKRDFYNNPISQASIDETLTYIRKWSEEGIAVFVFRPPTCEAMEEIEERKTKFSSFKIEDKIREHGGIYIDIPHSGWFSYDASHLDADSAKRLSELIGNAILQSQEVKTITVR